MQQHEERVVLEIMQTFKKTRLKKGLSHEALAKMIGVTRPAISHLENGKRKPSLLLSLRLAQALDIELADVLRELEQIQA